MEEASVWFYWRSYYDINRSTWPDLSRVQAAWDALKLACRVKGWLPMRGRR